MKEVLLSTQPKWCEKIGNNEKKIEVRKTRPKGQKPFKCYIYCTKGDKKEQALLLDINGRLSFGDYRNADNKDFYIANGKVIGEFICDKVYLIKNRGSRFTVADEEQSVTNEVARQSCLDYNDMVSYLGNKDGYGWHISDLKIYDKPKELSDFIKKCSNNKLKDCVFCYYYDFNKNRCSNRISRPPQSWQYVLEK